ncbi:general odorant-binding protein 19d-like [Anticarsia gemmatalis]|uniref:general odorant-binding protein 19d-like n=1 Tax=Anticarsia gemmatalis TaxID=129554 RepID=UPI003F771505
MHWITVVRANIRTMLRLYIALCVIPFIAGMRTQRSSGTMVDFTDPKVQGHLDALVRMAQSCVIKVRATPKDVRAYFTNSSPLSRSGQCFAACMLEQSDVINHGKVNRELLVHLASLVNGKTSRVVRKLKAVSRLCLDSIEGMSDRCQLASTYNDCLNENMIEFAFPLDIAEEAVRKMPFHLIQPNLPVEMRARDI